MSDDYLSTFVIPTNPKNVPIRPLDKGMIRNLPSQMAPVGSFYDLKGVITRNGVLERSPCFRFYKQEQGTIPDDLPLRGMHITWNSLGERDLVLNGSRNLYKVHRSFGVSRVRWQFVPTHTGLVSVDSGGIWHLVVSEDHSNQNIVVGDSLWIDDSGTIKKFDISAITYGSGTTDYAFRQPGYAMHTIAAGTYSFTIERNIRSWSPYTVDWVVFREKTIFADNSNRGLITYRSDTEQISLLNPNQNPALKMITCVDAFNDRLYVGGFIEDGIDHRNRIRWTDPLDETTFPSENYVDLLETDGEIYRMKALGPIHVAYFTDAIYIGRTTNYADLPVLYTKLDSGGIGLVGPRALASWVDGHYFVGQDDVYFLSGSLSLVPIGSTVIRRTIQECQNVSRIYVVPDPGHERILFGFPKISEQIVELWSFHPKQRSWSYEEVSCGMLAYAGDVASVLVGELTQPIGTYTEPIATWMGGEESREVFVSVDGFLLRTDDYAASSDIMGPVGVVIESQDMDLDLPDTVKTVTRLSFKIDRVLETGEQLIFELEYSLNRGRTWRRIGQVVIGEGDDEGRVNFLATGSIFRFRMRSRSAIRPYEISEFVLRVRPRGLEVST